MLKKILITFSLILLSACTSTKETASYVDMNDYEGFEGENTVFVASDVEDFLTRYENKETFIAYFGFSSCPWCNQIIQMLHDTAKVYDTDIYYIDTRANDEESNLEIPNYEDLVDAVGEYFDYDNDGLRHLYTPFVFFIEDGEVKETVTTIKEEDDSDVVDLEKEQELYNNGFESIGLEKIS